MNDAQTYAKYPEYRKWLNKLRLSETLGYYCGPSGISPSKNGWYIVRPVMNLSGMGVGAKRKYIKAGELGQVPPGYFWCEWFEGTQYSVTFELDKKWKQVSCWRAERNVKNLSQFKSWNRYEHKIFKLNAIFNEIKIPKINIEFIDDNPIELHLRDSPDPLYDEIIPIWEDNKELIDKYKNMGYNYITSYDNADGFLNPARLGFVVKNY